MSKRSMVMRQTNTLPYERKAVLYKAKAFDPLFQVKAVDDDKGIIQAYASKFDNTDEYNDVVLSGSYKRTLSNQRKSNRPYLYTYLFQHDPSSIIGGVKDADEDNIGLLYQAQCNMDTQLGRETYSNAKMGVLYQSSIGYDVPQGGAEYKEGIRYLKEIRLWEISLVTFAANPEATVVDVKTYPYEIQSKAASDKMETKGVCGNTSGAIGPRDEAWDGSKAEKQIWAVAAKEDGTIDVALCKKYFMSLNGDPQKKGSWGLPFWYVGDNPHICVGAVKAIAGWLQGARG